MRIGKENSHTCFRECIHLLITYHLHIFMSPLIYFFADLNTIKYTVSSGNLVRCDWVPYWSIYAIRYDEKLRLDIIYRQGGPLAGPKKWNPLHKISILKWTLTKNHQKNYLLLFVPRLITWMKYEQITKIGLSILILSCENIRQWLSN